MTETTDPKAVPEQANKRSDLLTPKELATELHCVLDKRDQMRANNSLKNQSEHFLSSVIRDLFSPCRN